MSVTHPPTPFPSATTPATASAPPPAGPPVPAAIRVVIAVAIVLVVALVAAVVWLLPYAFADGPRTLTEEFDGPAGSAPDPSVFSLDTGGGGWGNGELQAYTADAVALDGEGALVVTATIPRDGSQITSGRVTTKGLFSFQTGRLEARIQLPEGQGLLPAFWLQGDSVDVVGWPGSGEIDIVETPSTTATSSHHVHGPVTFTKKWSIGEGVRHDALLSEDYHVYGVNREPGLIELTIDGEVVMTVTPDDMPEGGAWVFDLPMHMLFTLAVGGDWPGDPDETTPAVAQMKIDWIRYTPVG